MRIMMRISASEIRVWMRILICGFVSLCLGVYQGEIEQKMRAEGAPENFWGYTKAKTLKTDFFVNFEFGKK